MGETASWKCNTCYQTEGVRNGVCPKCGAVQTTPLNDEAKREAGVIVDQVEVVEPNK